MKNKFVGAFPLVAPWSVALAMKFGGDALVKRDFVEPRPLGVNQIQRATNAGMSAGVT
jgi:hypothetical protein